MQIIRYSRNLCDEYIDARTGIGTVAHFRISRGSDHAYRLLGRSKRSFAMSWRPVNQIEREFIRSVLPKARIDGEADRFPMHGFAEYA